ncbi:MAG: helix-turn-helix transcriptional regulator [Oscillospiraceae bacterium]|nr:helix-turn-helix transcriptional regulator [Oscillospiraceae bacterium]
MLYSVEIGQNIVLMRRARRISQEQLALQSNISVSRLREIEHGAANATSDTLESIAKTLDVALPVLFIYSMEDNEVLDMLHTAQDSPKEAV